MLVGGDAEGRGIDVAGAVSGGVFEGVGCNGRAVTSGEDVGKDEVKDEGVFSA